MNIPNDDRYRPVRIHTRAMKAFILDLHFVGPTESSNMPRNTENCSNIDRGGKYTLIWTFKTLGISSSSSSKVYFYDMIC